MEMVPADFVSDEDREIQRILDEHPLLRSQFTRLINGYREIITMLLEDEDNHADKADISKSCMKKENAMRRMGIPILDTPEDYHQFFLKRA